MRMRMIEPDNVESAGASLTPSANVIRRVDQEPRRVVGQVGCSNRRDNLAGRSDEHPATFGGRRFTRVGDHFLAHGMRQNHSVSTIIAMPMPPPMHSDANP